MMVPAKRLNIDQRIMLLQNGLNDRYYTHKVAITHSIHSNNEVVKSCADMLCNGWLKSSNGDPLKVVSWRLLKLLKTL